MIREKFFILLFLIAPSLSHAFIYGEFDYVSIDAIDNPYYQLASKAVGAMISDDKILMKSNGKALIKGIPLTSKLMETGSDYEETKYAPICSSEPFIDEYQYSHCTVFLISEDVIVTAGHCLDGELLGYGANVTDKDCSDLKYKFSFDINDSTVSEQEANVYSCNKIIRSQTPRLDGPDYAIIKLDRKVEGVRPLPVDKDFLPTRGDRVVSIGNPLELGKKLVLPAPISNVNPGTILTSLDAIGGQSGSPVFDEKTGKVIGILIQAGSSKHFKLVEKNGKSCFQHNRIETVEKIGDYISKKESMAGGAKVVRLSNFSQISNTNDLTYEQAFNNSSKLKSAIEKYQEGIDEIYKDIEESKRISSLGLSRSQNFMKFGKVSQGVSRTLTKPFTWTSKFFKGLLKSEEKQNLPKLTQLTLFYALAEKTDLNEIYASSRSEEEFINKLQDLATDILSTELQKEYTNLKVRINEESSLSDEEIYHKLKDNAQLERIEGIYGRELTFEEFNQLNHSLLDLSLQSDELTKGALKDYVARLITGPVITGMVFKSLSLLYTIPSLVFDVGTAASYFKCFSKKTKESFAWFDIINIKRQNSEFEQRFIKDKLAIENYEYVKSFKNFCVETVMRNALEVNKVKAKGQKAGLKFKKKVKSLMRKR